MNKFNLLKLLNDNNLKSYMYSDKVIQVNCPFCTSKTTGEHDTKFHMGIFVDSNEFSCFRCKRKGMFSYYFKCCTGKDISTEENSQTVTDTLKQELNKKFKSKMKVVKKPNSNQILIPGIPIDSELVKHTPVIKKFMKRRNLSIETVEEYNATYGGVVGEYAHRMILPIYDNDIPVFFQARDMTERASNKYDAPEGSLGNYLYTVHKYLPNKTLYIVEGIFDAWRVGANVVATFGVGMTYEQKNKLIKLKQKLSSDKLVIAYDCDAENIAIKLKRELSDYFDYTGFMKISEGHDPDSLGADFFKQRIYW